MITATTPLVRRGDWFQTFTGKRFWALDPRPEEVDIEDVAHALSNICRFNGHCREFYSVAQHSVLVSRVVPQRDALWALLHDASEAYLCDLVRPVKKQPELAAYTEIETRVMRVICEAFGLPPEMPESVRFADNRMLFTEKRDLCVLGQAHWDGEVPPYDFTIEPITPAQAKAVFLETFGRLYFGGL